MPPRSPRAAILSLSLAVCSALGCQDGKSSLEQLADAERAEAQAELEYASVPAPGPAPAGIDAAVWADIGWFPASATELSVFRHQLAFVDWVRGLIEAYAPRCEGVLDGVDRYYMVQRDPAAPSQTLVFYAPADSLDRVRVEDCARLIAPSVGAAASDIVSDGEFTRLGSKDAAGLVRWAKRGDELVIVYEGEASRTSAMLGTPAAGPSLDAEHPLMAPLRAMPTDITAVASLTDLTSVFLRTPSEGYVMTMSLALLPEPSMNLKFQFLFADEATASRANTEADLFIAELTAAGLDERWLHNDGAEGQNLRVRLSVSPAALESAGGDVEAVARPILELMNERRAEAGVDLMDTEAMLGHLRELQG